MDKRTNYEVLQEMGVSLLEPDDNEQSCELSSSSGGHHHKGTKRKRDIENVNPNTNSCSPITKRSPGPSKAKSPRVHTGKPLQQTDCETTLVEGIAFDEETPLAQCISAYVPREQRAHPSPVRTPSSPARRPAQPRGAAPRRCGADSFSVLSDEMILSVFRWLPKRTLAHCMLVCKRWYRIASDETLWQRLDLGNKAIARDALGKILDRKPVIVRLASSEIGSWCSGSTAPSRVQYLDLSMCSIQLETLDRLLENCPGLKKLSLESVNVADTTCAILGRCTNLETLNMTMAQGITAEGSRALLEGCVNLQSLNISWCNLSEAALQVLVDMLPRRLQRLNLGGARIMTDELTERLCARCPRLAELDLSDCSRLTPRALQSLVTLGRLEHAALSRCYMLSGHTLSKLSAMPSLRYLEVWGMLQAPNLSLLKANLPSIQINHFMFSAIARPTVGTRRSSVWGLRTREIGRAHV